LIKQNFTSVGPLGKIILPIHWENPLLASPGKNPYDTYAHVDPHQTKHK